MKCPSFATRLERGRSLTTERLATALIFVAIGATAALMPAQSDTYWHLRAGQLFWSTGEVPLVDSFSHTAVGREWPNHEWLWQAVSYPLFRLGGFPLLTAFGAALIVSAYLLVWRLMKGDALARFGLLAATLPVAPMVWALRPQLVTLVLLALLLTLLVSDRLWAIPPLFLAWANFHGAVAIGGAVMIAVTVAAALRERWRLPRLALVTAVSGLATLATPLGPRLFAYVLESIGRSSQVQIEEWQPVGLRAPEHLLFLLLAAGLVVLVARRWRRIEGWPALVLAASCCVLLPLALRYSRNVTPFLLLAAPLASHLLADARDVGASGKQSAPGGSATNVALLAGSALCLALAVAFAWSVPWRRLGWKPIAPAALKALAGCKGKLYNRYYDGGYLIWLAPERPVYLDNRQDPYPADFVLAHTEEESRGVHPGVLARRGIACAFLPPRSRSVASLRAGRWRQSYRDDRWVVLAAD